MLIKGKGCDKKAQAGKCVCFELLLACTFYSDTIRIFCRAMLTTQLISILKHEKKRDEGIQGPAALSGSSKIGITTASTGNETERIFF